MLHGNPYQRPYMHEVLNHPWVLPTRVPDDTFLGDLGEAEAAENVLLLQIKRPSGRPLDLKICYMDLAEINDPKVSKSHRRIGTSGGGIVTCFLVCGMSL